MKISPDSDAGKMLAELQAHPGEWISSNLLKSHLHLTANSRAADLRKAGYNVECAVCGRIPGTRKMDWRDRIPVEAGGVEV